MGVDYRAVGSQFSGLHLSRGRGSGGHTNRDGRNFAYRADTWVCLASKPSILLRRVEFGLFSCLASLWSQALSSLLYSLSQIQLKTLCWYFFWSQASTGSTDFLSSSDVPPSPLSVFLYQRRCSSFSLSALLLSRRRSSSSSSSCPCSSFSHQRHHRKGARGMVDHGQDEDVFCAAPVLLCDAVLLWLLLGLTWRHRRSGA